MNVKRRFVVLDRDGTIIEERIIHGAGTPTERGMTRVTIKKLISDAGRQPVERDTLYNPVPRVSELVYSHADRMVEKARSNWALRPSGPV